jgi:uncharacterized membrane protein
VGETQSRDTVPGTRTPGWVRALLIASLAANLAVAGIVAGAAWRGGDRGAPRDVGFGPFTEALSREDRALLRKEFLARSPDMRDMRRAMREDARAVLVALRAEPFDEAAFRRALSDHRSRIQDRVSLGETLLVDRVAGMTPEDRRAFADRLEDRLRRGPKPGGGP